MRQVVNSGCSISMPKWLNFYPEERKVDLEDSIAFLECLTNRALSAQSKMLCTLEMLWVR